jgi:hypothetical protein
MLNYDLFLEKMRATGMDYRWSTMFVKKLRDDENAFIVTDKKKKQWALERGFYPGRIELYGLDEDNYMSYIPDFQYFMLHPMNHHFRIWLGDKLTCKYVLNSEETKTTMPRYFVYVENNGNYTYLMDCPSDDFIAKDENFLMNLLKHEGTLALKPNSGTSGGLGFIKLEMKDGTIFENNSPITIERFCHIRDSIRNYIITEYCHQHKDLSLIWPKSECTLRVIMCKNPSNNRFNPPTWTCAISYARFGTSTNGGASNLSSGGVGVGFNFETGKCNNFAIRYKRFTPDGRWFIDRHPDTGVKWDNVTLPNWNLCRQKIDAVCHQISSLDYLGLDIIITEDGMKLCEINTHPAMDYEQVMCGPVLNKEASRVFFEHKGLRKVSGEILWKSYEESQILTNPHI